MYLSGLGADATLAELQAEYAADLQAGNTYGAMILQGEIAARSPGGASYMPPPATPASSSFMINSNGQEVPTPEAMASFLAAGEASARQQPTATTPPASGPDHDQIVNAYVNAASAAAKAAGGNAADINLVTQSAWHPAEQLYSAILSAYIGSPQNLANIAAAKAASITTQQATAAAQNAAFRAEALAQDAANPYSAQNYLATEAAATATPAAIAAATAVLAPAPHFNDLPGSSPAPAPESVASSYVAPVYSLAPSSTPVTAAIVTPAPSSSFLDALQTPIFGVPAWMVALGGYLLLKGRGARA